MGSVAREISGRLQKRMDNIHVLVVDGSAKVGELIKSILKQLGFNNVFIAENGLHGIKLSQDVRFDIVITDSELHILKNNAFANDDAAEPSEILPVRGSLFVKRLRFSPASPTPFVPVIMLLKKASVGDILDARDSGVDEVVIKPFRADEFCTKIKAVIETPRAFVTSSAYRGPCRRRSNKPLPAGNSDRRKMIVRLVRHNSNKRR